MLVDLDIKEFLERLAAGEPTPGGGSASALAGGLAAALGEMVCNLTIPKPKYEAVRGDMETALSSFRLLRRDLLGLVDRDSEAYDQVSQALKLPRGTPEEKAARKLALGRASRFATEVPLKTAGSCLAVLEALVKVAEHGNVNAISDVGVAAHLAHTGLTGAVLNVRINLSGIPDRKEAEALAGGASAMEREAGARLNEISGMVARRMDG